MCYSPWGYKVRHSNWATTRLSHLIPGNMMLILEKEMATHSSTLAWKIPWTEKPGRLQSMGSQRVGHDWANSLHFTFWCSSWKITHHKARGQTCEFLKSCESPKPKALERRLLKFKVRNTGLGRCFPCWSYSSPIICFWIYLFQSFFPLLLLFSPSQSICSFPFCLTNTFFRLVSSSQIIWMKQSL